MSREHRRKNKAVTAAAVLLLLTVIAAAVHLKTRDTADEGTLLVTIGGTEKRLELSALSYLPVTGVRVNGKGEEIAVDAPGISLKDVVRMVADAEYETVTVISDDSYQAELSFSEVENGNTAFLVTDDEKSLRLVVFGDSNSKRSVSNVVQIFVK